MESVGDYLKDSNKFYESMPEETNELYKKKYVPINLDNIARAIDFGANEGKPKTQPAPRIASFFSEHFSDSEIKFDALLGDGGFVAAGLKAKYMRFVRQDEGDYENLSGQFMEAFDDDKYTAFMYSYAEGILHVRIPKGEKAQLNILLANVERPFSMMIFFDVEEGARLDVMEFFTSGTAKQSFLGVVNIARLSSDAKAEINMLHNEGHGTDVVSMSYMKALDNASVKSNYIYVGGNRVKAKNRLDALGASSKVEANEVALGNNKQAFDINTKIVNRYSGTNSEAKLDSKAVLFDEAACYLKGFSKIEAGAKGAKSFVTEGGFHLSKNAKIEAMPDMSIDEKDVKATHSSAIGPINQDVLFYLMSRGMESSEARNLVISGFLTSTISNIESGIAKAYSLSLINRKISGKEEIGLPKIESQGMWLESRRGSDIFGSHYKYRVV
ncbi:MAG: SufD family Fe-S cluster assembly protein [Candidatus Micrarchaeaceae archaeon]